MSPWSCLPESKSFRVLAAFVRRWRVVAFAAVAVCAWATPAAADLGGDIRSILRDRMLTKASVGVCIERLGPDAARCAALYEFNPAVPLTPASNLKVVTTSAMLDRVGPDFRFHTSLVLRGNDLVIIGDGDPTFGDAELLKKSNWGTRTVFENWAKLLHQRGITHLDRVLVDDSIFDEVFFHPDWPVAQAHLRYEAAIGGVNLNANCVDFYLHVSNARQLVTYSIDPPTNYITVHNACVAGSENAVWLSRAPGSNDVTLRGQADASNDQPISVSVQDPPLFAAAVLSETVAASGITVSGAPGRDRTVRKAVLDQTPATAAGEATTVLAVHETPLAAALARANKDSMNLYAECLCKRLGAITSPSGDNGSWANGVAAVRAFLGKVGVPEEQFHLDDGSGLSHENAITARALCQVLIYDYLSKNRSAFMDSLGIAGVDGRYFQQRFANTDLRGRVLGKSGFVNGVSGLTGFLKAKDGNWYCFSILMNGIPNGGNSTAKSLQERIVAALDNSTVGAASAAAR